MVAAIVFDRCGTAWRHYGGTSLFLILACFCLAASGTEMSYEKRDQMPPNTQTALLREGRDGIYYGLARIMGNNSETNELFRLNSRGQRQVLHRLTPREGVGISTPPLMAGDGLIYGSTQFGGENGTGTIFRYNPRTGGFTKLVDFPPTFLQGTHLSCIGPDGELYGFCSRSQGNEAGLLFRCTRDGELSVIYRFGSEQFSRLEPGSIGYSHLQWPRMLRLGRDGWLYGATQSGGPLFKVQAFAGLFHRSYGTLFRCSIAGELQVLATFNPTTGNAPAEVVEGPDGALYGFVEHHEFRDSENRYKGQVLRVDQTGKVSILHAFQEHQSNGYTDHLSGPFIGGNGRMFAIRPGNGPNQASRLFEFTPQGVIRDVFTFSRSDGEQPPGALTFGSDGVFRGISSGHYQHQHIFVLGGDFGPPLALEPIARDDYFVYREKPITMDVMSNDSRFAFLTEWTQPASGTVSLADDGSSLIYTPGADAPALQRFTYRYVDVLGDGAYAIGTVYLQRPSKGGTYAGFPPSPEESEYLRVKISKSSLLTGVLFTSGRRFQLRGRLNENRAFTFETTTPLPNIPTTLQLILEQDPTTQDSLDVTLRIGETTRQFRLDKQPAHTPDAAGLYTFILPPAKDQPIRYAGTGYGVLRISTAGRAIATGKLADGKAFSIGGHVTDTNSVALFSTLYRERSFPVPPAGFLKASIQLEAKAGKYDYSGDLLWNRPSAYRNDKMIPALVQKQRIIGSRWERGYHFSAPTSPVGRAQNAEVLLHESNAQTSATTASLEGTRFFAPGWPLSGLINPRTGLMAGTFIHPRSGIRTPFAGVFLPAAGRASGMFFTRDGTRTFELLPH